MTLLRFSGVHLTWAHASHSKYSPLPSQIHSSLVFQTLASTQCNSHFQEQTLPHRMPRLVRCRRMQYLVVKECSRCTQQENSGDMHCAPPAIKSLRIHHFLPSSLSHSPLRAFPASPSLTPFVLALWHATILCPRAADAGARPTQPPPIPSILVQLPFSSLSLQP